MLDNLKELIQEIRIAELEKIDPIKSIQRSNYFSKKYEEILSKWIQECKKGYLKLADADKVKETLNNEIEIRKKNGEYPSPKRINSLWILIRCKEKLNYLYYEFDKLKISNFSCNCSLRQKYNLEPVDFNLLKKYCRVNHYHIEDEYIVYKCVECSAKWLKAFSSELKITMNWMMWNPKDYPLVEKI